MLSRVGRLLRRKLVAVPLALLVLYALLGFVVVPRIARTQLEQRLTVLLHRPVTVQEVGFNPFSLAATIRGFTVTEPGGAKFVSFDELFVDVGFFKLLTGKVGFDAIRLTKPAIAVSLLKNGALSFADLLEKDPNAPPPPPPDPNEKPVTIVVDALDLAAGTFEFTDLKRQEPFTAKLTPLSLSLRDFTTETGRNSRYAFTAKLGDATLVYDGDFSARPLKSKGTLSMKGIRLDAFQPYIAEATQLRLVSGAVDVEGSYDLDGASTPLRFVLENGRLQLSQLRVDGVGEKEPLFELGSLSVAIPRADVASKTVQVKDVVLSKGVVRARREKSGELQWARLAKPARAASAAAPDAGQGPAVATSAPPAASEKPSPWTVSVGRVALEDWALHWNDLDLEYPVTVKVDQLGLEVEKVRWPLAGPVDAKLHFRWMDRGTVSLEGPITPEPLAAAVAVQVNDFDLSPFDGYLWEHALNGTLQRGVLSTALKVTLGDGGSVSAAGAVHLRDLAMLDEADKPLLDLKALDLEGLDYRGGAKTTVALERIRLAGLSLKVEKDEKGGMNLSRLSKPPKPGAAAAAPPPPPPKNEGGFSLKVAAIDLAELGVDWLDKTTKPAFAASMKRVAGRITNVTWPQTQRTGLALTGRLDQAPLKLGGTLLVNGKDSFSDLKIGLDGYDLPRTSPYSVAYVAQPINRAKLTLGLVYKVGQRRIEAANHVLVDQLEFGDAVPDPGPDAKKLPLGLAVAILSDKDGRIELDLPMTGDLDDPEFAWGGMVWKVLLNLMEKVATAPFTLVGSLFAGENPDALKSLAFAAGARAPSPDEAQKVATLARLLSERPKLGLELAPGADPLADREALARAQLRQSLLAKRGGAGADAGALEVDAAGYARLLAAAWRRQVGGADAGPEPSAEQMETDLAARQKVSDEDLEGLRRDRAAWVQAALEEKGIPVTRVFVVEGGAAPNQHGSVEIGLK